MSPSPRSSSRLPAAPRRPATRTARRAPHPQRSVSSLSPQLAAEDPFDVLADALNRAVRQLDERGGVAVVGAVARQAPADGHFLVDAAVERRVGGAAALQV